MIKARGMRWYAGQLGLESIRHVNEPASACAAFLQEGEQATSRPSNQW